MRGIKIPLQDFALKMQGGSVFVGHYGTTASFADHCQSFHCSHYELTRGLFPATTDGTSCFDASRLCINTTSGTDFRSTPSAKLLVVFPECYCSHRDY